MPCSLQQGRSPLHVAAMEGRTGIVNAFIKHGAIVDGVSNSTRYYQLQAYQCYWIRVSEWQSCEGASNCNTS